MTTVSPLKISDAESLKKLFSSRPCCFSFEDLYCAAFESQMSDSIRALLRNMNQSEKNKLVKMWVERTNGQYVCDDRLGTDGIVYTAFWEKEE